MSSSHAFDQEALASLSPVAAFPHPRPLTGETYTHSETTRLLCAAAYLDREFRDLVVKHCVHSKHRALGVCFGVDMPTVVRHCCRAKRVLDDRGLWLLIPGLLAAILVVVAFASANSSDSSTLLAVLLMLGVVYLISFTICLVFESRARRIVLQNFVRGNFKPEALLQAGDTNVDYLKEAETGNAVVYSGFTPFVGSGENMGAWSFAIDLRKCPDDLTGKSRKAATQPANRSFDQLQEITLNALYDRVAENIAALDIDRVTIQDKLYVNGSDIRDDKRFLSEPLGRPRYRVDDKVMNSAMLEQTDKQLRHYRCIRIVDWQGELVVSIFLRFSKIGHNLFVEASYYLLAPVAERFRGVDAMNPKLRFRQILAGLVATAIKTPFVTLWAPFSVLNRISEGMRRSSERRQEEELIRENPTFDYGAAFSFRQWASAKEYRRYFQRLDKEMYLKVLEKNILDSILTFLEENNVDVSDLKQRKSVILNQGVILSGGNMTTQNMAVGLGAAVENVTQKVSQFAAKATSPAGQPG